MRARITQAIREIVNVLFWVAVVGWALFALGAAAGLVVSGYCATSALCR